MLNRWLAVALQTNKKTHDHLHCLKTKWGAVLVLGWLQSFIIDAQRDALSPSPTCFYSLDRITSPNNLIISLKKPKLFVRNLSCVLLPPTGYGLFQLQRKAASRTNESYSVVWLRVKLVEAILLENRCVNGLVHRLYPPAASPALMKNNGFIPEGRGPQVTPPPPPASASLQWLCWQANRWLGWVASGLCALSVIKGRKKVYGLLVSDPPNDGMSSKHPAISNLLRGLVGVGVCCNMLFRKQPTGLCIKLDYSVHILTTWLWNKRNE